MPNPDSAFPATEPLPSATDVDLESLPEILSLVKFSLRHLLWLTAALSTYLAMGLAFFPRWFECSRDEVGRLFVGLLIGFALVATLIFFRRWSIERRLGRRILRVYSQQRWASLVAPLLFAVSVLQLVAACHKLELSELDSDIQALKGGVFAAAAWFCWSWRHALRSIEFGEHGYSLHALAFTPWGREPVRWVADLSGGMTLCFGRSKHRSLTADGEQKAVVRALLTHSGADCD